MCHRNGGSCLLEVFPQSSSSSSRLNRRCAFRARSTHSSSSDQDSVPEWIEEVVQLSEQGEVLDSYKGYREAVPGFDEFVYVGEKKKKALTDEQIVENICNVIRRWGWGSQAENELENMTFRPTSYHIIEVLKQFRDMDILMGFFRWSRGQKWYCPDILVFNLLIDRAGLNRDFEKVLWLQNTMKEDCCPLTSVTLNILIKCYLRASKLEEALSCFVENTRSSKDLKPDLMTCNTLIGSCVDGGLHQRAIEIFNTMEGFGLVPEKHLYEIMIPVFVKAGNLEKAGKLFEEMRSKGNQASLSLYACLIDSLGRAGRLDFAMKLFSEIKDFGKTPSAGMHVSLIESFAKAGKLEMAMKILGLMQKADHIPTASVFTCLIDTHLKARQLDKAMQLLGTMMKVGHLPSRALYSSFIDAHLKARELNTAIKLFVSMQDAGVLPTPPVCTSLVHCSALTGDLQTTMKLFQSMHKLGFRHGEGTYALVLPLLMKQSPQDQLVSFIQEMKANHYPVDGLASNALMGILLDGHTIQACECYKVLMSMNIEVNSRVSRHVMEASLKDGHYDVGKMAVDRLMKSGFKADLRMYTLILSCFARCEAMDKEELIMSMLSSTEHSAHKFLCGLLASPDQRNDSALNFVRSYFESLEREVDEKLARWFTCVVLNYLVLMGQIKRARCVWKVAYERKLFPNRILFDQELVWSLDVRALSIGAALTAIVHTLHRFRKRMIHYHTMPRRIKIVTGNTLNDPIQDLLRPLDSPFENHGGALRCRGAYVAQWFNKPIIEKFLENELPSREELVMQKISMLFPRPKPEPYMLIVNSATAV
jgi:pentatricopeptide repeat protein